MALLAAPERTARPWLGDVAEEAGTKSPCAALAHETSFSQSARWRAPLRAARLEPGWRPCAASDAVDLLATLVADGNRLPAKAKPGTVAAAGVFGAAAAALAASES